MVMVKVMMVMMEITSRCLRYILPSLLAALVVNGSRYFVIMINMLIDHHHDHHHDHSGSLRQRLPASAWTSPSVDLAMSRHLGCKLAMVLVTLVRMKILILGGGGFLNNKSNNINSRQEAF